MKRQEVNTTEEFMQREIVGEKEEEIPLYEEESESSTVIFYLRDSDKVTILEEFEEFSLIEFYVDDEDEALIGFVKNQYIEKEDETLEQNDKQSPQDQEDNEEKDVNENEALHEDSERDEANAEDQVEVEEEDEESPNLYDDEESIDVDDQQSFTVYSSGSQETYHGIALKNKTHVYKGQSRDNKGILKSYNEGSVLKYRSLSGDWYEATVKVNGKWEIGYIHKSDVENVTESQRKLQGIALLEPTHVYSRASTNSSNLKSYPAGSILKYKTFTSNWYQATVYVNGKWTTGYIHKSHVENATSSQENLQGVGLKSPTHVYANASTSSKSLKSYSVGSILKYRTFTSNWYQATVYINGKRTTGYIHKSHVENAESKQESLEGIGKQSPTHVYSSASTSSKVLKSYPVGSMLKYRTFSKDWYQATVYLNGKRTTGYIHKSHVENTVSKQESLEGIGKQSPTHVYSSASTSSKILKSYPKGSILKYRTFSKDWYQATVYLNGKRTTGYIHKSHVENKVKNQEDLQGVGIKELTPVYERASKSSTILRKYPYGKILKYKTFASDWYEATIYISGKATTVYIHKDDVGPMDYRLEGFAHKSPTKVYGDTSKNSAVLRDYQRGSKLIYRAFNHDWYSATVRINGAWETGYIHVDDVSYKMRDLIYETNYGYDFKDMADRQVNKQPTSDGAGKIKATRGEIEFYSNPLNFPKTTDEYYQFLVLSKPAGLDAKQINEKILKGKGSLEGTAQAFISAANRFSINEAYLIAHALHETGNGKSTLAQGIPVDAKGHVTRDSKGNIAKTSATKHTVYNMFGYGAKDSCPIDCGAKYAFDNQWYTIEDSIIGGIESIYSYISRGQNTLYKMRWNPDGGLTPPAIPEWYQYATHIQWAVIQTRRIAEIYSLLEDYTLEIDVPTFNNTPNTGITTPNALNFRNGPSTSYDSIGTIPKGSEVQIIGSNVNAWYNIKYNGKTGWVSAKYVNLKYK